MAADPPTTRAPEGAPQTQADAFAQDNAWRSLAAQLQRFEQAGRVATFWWRDDDAGQACPALDRLLALAGPGRPLALATIPKMLTAEAAAQIAQAGLGVRVLPHGYAHENHAPAGEKKAEFGAHRPIERLIEDTEKARALLHDAIAERLVPIFVPPWNRMDPDLCAHLMERGWLGVSTHKPRAPEEAAWRLNVHIDIVDWKHTRGFIGTKAALDQAVAHLTARFDGTPGIDANEPTGLMTHHLAHDEDCWGFTARFLKVIEMHPAAKIIDAREGFRT